LSQALKAVAVAGLIGAPISGLWLLATVPGVRGEGSIPMVALLIFLGERFVWLLIAFLIETVVSLAVSKALGGQGSLSTQSYLLGASTAPMSILRSVVQIVPLVGGGLVLTGMLYSAYLRVLGLCAAHKYGWRKGTLAWVIAALGWGVVRASLALALRPPPV
jgi:hypothetical protein